MRNARLLSLTALLAAFSGAYGDSPSAQDSEFFEAKVRPLLVKHCYECHAAESKKLGGKLRLDLRDGWQIGGESGPAIEPGKPEDSLLIKAVLYDGFEMPPTGRLAESDVAILREWVIRGAPDPRDGKITSGERPWSEIFAERRKWWSLQPPSKKEIPLVKNAQWPGGDIDRFLLARMEAANLSPNEITDRRTLIRRLTLVLTGLPPKPEAIEQFVSDTSPEAYEHLVDRLLASPNFGERWARHWLDVIRFSETHGNEWNYDVHFAWRYRDYVVRALNNDVPYNQFVKEHIAGDLLEQPRLNADEHFNESVIGTAFWRFGEANHDSCLDFQTIGYDILDNQVDTFSKAFQATTIACARCHDHKMDAVSTRDYYSLLSMLRNARPVAHTIDGPEVNASTQTDLERIKKEIEAELEKSWRDESKEFAKYFHAAESQRKGEPVNASLDAARLAKWVAALAVEKPALESPVGFWRSFVEKEKTVTDAAQRWRETAERYAAESKSRIEFNKSQLVTVADFHNAENPGWSSAGQGLRNGAARSGELVLAPTGDSIVKLILPASMATSRFSERLNGALRSPSLVGETHKKISFRVAGDHGSAVRLVVNNCQLNYSTYRVLHSGNWQWVTFNIPDKASELGLYAELMTFWDNPKFPDPLGTLGGDKANHREPFDAEAQDPRSWWAVTRAVVHDGEAPREDLSHLHLLYSREVPTSAKAAEQIFASAAQSAVVAWADRQATDDEVRWLSWLLESGLLSNTSNQSPRLTELVAAYRESEAKLSTPRVVPGMADGNEGLVQKVFVRGESTRPGDKVERRYLEALEGKPFMAGSGRRELAEQLADAKNPLTARVMVNRIWQHVFGVGIVATPDDFGHMGTLPSHPELLDHLATTFVEDGWSIKRQIRRLVLSKAFQQASTPSAAAKQHDPQNVLLSHFAPRRLEAEAIRDALLAVSGQLDERLGGPSVHPFREKADTEKRLYVGPLNGNGRRSLYIKVQLMEQAPFLNAFNLPDGKSATGKRDVTNVPSQSLAMLNDPLVIAQAKAWSEKLILRTSDTVDQRIDHMFFVAIGRPPSDAERVRFAALVNELSGQQSTDEMLKSASAWENASHALFNTVEFVFIP